MDALQQPAESSNLSMPSKCLKNAVLISFISCHTSAQKFGLFDWVSFGTALVETVVVKNLDSIHNTPELYILSLMTRYFCEYYCYCNIVQNADIV